ncbi:MAG: cation transporter [Myxococcota bacterium]
MADMDALKVILGSVVANLGIVAAMFFAASMTNSAAVWAGAILSLAVCGIQVPLLVAARDAADRGGRIQPLRAIFSGLLPFGGGGVFAVINGLRHLWNPQTLSDPVSGYIALCGVVGISGYALMRSYNALEGAQAQDPGVSMLFAQNAVATLSAAIAFAALAAHHGTGVAAYDANGSIAVGVLMFGMAVWLTGAAQSAAGQSAAGQSAAGQSGMASQE